MPTQEESAAVYENKSRFYESQMGSASSVRQREKYERLSNEALFLAQTIRSGAEIIDGHIIIDFTSRDLARRFDSTPEGVRNDLAKIIRESSVTGITGVILDRIRSHF